MLQRTVSVRFSKEAWGVRLVRRRTSAGLHGDGDGFDGGQVFVRDFEEAGVSFGVVAEDAGLVHGWHDVEAAVFKGGVDEGDPAGDDEMTVAVGEEIAGVLVPGDFAAVPAGELGADAIDG